MTKLEVGSKFYNYEAVQKYMALNYYYVIEGFKVLCCNNANCFEEVWKYSFPKNDGFISVHIAKNRFPYGAELIAKWVALLNNWGFPCAFCELESEYHFIVPVSKYNKRPHLMSTLTLLRYLWEGGQNIFPAITFGLMEKYPTVDSFILMQLSCHFIVNVTKDPYSNYNINHCVNGKVSGLPISQEEFKNRLEKNTSFLSSYRSKNEDNSVHKLFLGEPSHSKFEDLIRIFVNKNL